MRQAHCGGRRRAKRGGGGGAGHGGELALRRLVRAEEGSGRPGNARPRSLPQRGVSGGVKGEEEAAEEERDGGA